jgi:ABC-type uncharacterized transport system permease subunit
LCVIALHQIAAAIYLAAGVGALLGLVLPSTRMARGGVWGLALAAAVHAVAFASLHRADPTPPLTDLPSAVSLMAWIGNLVLLILMWRLRIIGMAAVVGPVSFLAVFYAALRLPHAAEPMLGSGSWPHAHVVLGSAGVAIMGLAGISGAFFLIEHRRMKQKRPISTGLKLPSLEALDRINVASLAVGFALLTLGVFTGVLWIREAVGELWRGSAHEYWTMVAWGIYAGLVAARFVGKQGARQAAASAVAGSAFLLFAVVGVGLLV